MHHPVKGGKPPSVKGPFLYFVKVLIVAIDFVTAVLWTTSLLK